MAERRPKPETTKSAKPGPKPERVKVKGNWEDAVERALNVRRPASGWPKPSKGSS